MKTYFLAVALFSSLFSFSQSSVKISVTGIAPEVEQKILNDDMIPEAFGLNNVTLRLKNVGQKNWTLSASAIYKVVYDPATRHYTVNIKWDVKPSKWYSFEKPVTIRVIARTKFYNAIWAEVTRNPSEIEQPIVLNQYTYGEESASAAIKGFLVTGKEFQPLLTNKFLPGDDVLNKGNNVLIRVKNQGEKDWAQENSFTYAAPTGRVWLKVPLTERVDVTRPVLLQVGIKTKFGNYVWGEKVKNLETFQQSEMSFLEYSGKVGDATAALNKAGTPDQPKRGNKELIATPIFGANKDPKPKATKGISLTQHGGTIEVAKAPDSMLNANLKSTLLQSTTITVGLQQIAIKGNKPIEYNPGLGYVLMAWSDGNQVIRTDHGSIKIKDETPLFFSKYRVTGAMLAEPATLNTEYGQLTFGVGSTSAADILFEEAGKLKEGTLSANAKLNVGDAPLELPAGSRLRFRNKKLSEVFLTNQLFLLLSGQKFTVKAAGDGPSIWMDERKGTVDAFIAGENNSVIVEGISVPIKAGAKATLDYKDRAYFIRRFYLKEPMTLKEYGRKGKVKEVEAKEGKRITVQEGKITDIS